MNRVIPKRGGCVKGCRAVGRRGLPAEELAVLYADYQALGSLAKVGAKHNRSGQSVYEIFKRAGLARQPRLLQAQRIYKGRKFAPDSYGYWRELVANGRAGGPEKMLHRIVWTERRGPIPDGHDVGFKDGDKNNCRIGNLICLPHAEMTRRHATGNNQFTLNAELRLGLLIAGKGRGLVKLT